MKHIRLYTLVCFLSLFSFSFQAQAGFPRPGSPHRPTTGQKENPAKKAAHCNRYVSSMLALQKENKKFICKINLTNMRMSAGQLRSWCLRTTTSKSTWDLNKYKTLVSRCKNSPLVRHCKSYAYGADVLKKINLNLQCGFSGGRWYDTYDKHYAWCMQTEIAVSKNENFIRSRDIKICAARKKKEAYCKRYADGAVSAYQAVLRNRCKFSNTKLFHGDRSAHYNWCLQVSEGQTSLAMYSRGTSLQSCCYNKKCN